MNVPLRSVRRATLDDLPTLVSLWKLEQLPHSDLERRFKEFQVAESTDGSILGVIGVHVAGAEARLHSEAYLQFDQADALREKLWERIKVMGDNQGWVRVWTDLASQTWRRLGFDPPNPDQLSRLPESFSHACPRGLHVIQIREDKVGGPSVDAEFQILKMAYQEENQRLLKRARTLRLIAVVIAAGLVAWIGWWGTKLYKHRDQLPRRELGR